jgi:hypothetical protein
MSRLPKKTGLVCPKCKTIDPINRLMFKCPACGNEWAGSVN